MIRSIDSAEHSIHTEGFKLAMADRSVTYRCEQDPKIIRSKPSLQDYEICHNCHKCLKLPFDTCMICNDNAKLPNKNVKLTPPEYDEYAPPGRILTAICCLMFGAGIALILSVFFCPAMR